MHKWANFLNAKAASMGAGVQGGVYPDIKPFSYEDIEKHLALYILQGLNPLPQVEQKLASQANDTVQGNNLHFTIGQARSKHDHTSSGVKHVVYTSVLSASHCFTHLRSPLLSRLV